MADLKVAYDPQRDVLEIEGVKYSGEIFRTYGGLQPLAPEHYLKIEKREPGETLTLFRGTLCEACKNAWEQR